MFQKGKNRILVDADACPKPVKDIIFRAAQRFELETILVANQYVAVPRSPLIKCKVVNRGFDEADNWIVENCQTGDLVITQDIPLAALAIEKEAIVVSPKGDLYDKENIRQRLSMRNFMEELRSAGENTGGPAPFSQTDRRNFANQLDRLVANAK